ncbi:hypothetical protein [Pseudomonas sp. NFACC45]|uniref:hypothetical protein n=1 Tax=Pseudomonas sp. NFACC45 TaxID=1566201 RepID=UPI0008E1CDBE|nr:hypothetical protein [Pseudomonas sp. NFACC45]SFH12697.1 hypothetical protein SAMN03159297_03209 [Pseudomonas sp. NFACC45]
MIDWVAAAFSSAKAAGDIAKSLVTLRDEELVRGRVMELTSTLMDLQQQMMQGQLEQMALIKKIADLEDALKSTKAKQNVLERYELRGVGPAKVVYALKPEYADAEPAHFCCTNCYDKGHRSVLKAMRQNNSTSMKFSCPECSNTFFITGEYLPDTLKAR